MIERAAVEATKMVMTCDGLQALIDDFAGRSYQVLGPTVRDGATVYDTIAHLRNRNTFRQKWRWFFNVAAPTPGKYSGEMETASPSESEAPHRREERRLKIATVRLVSRMSALQWPGSRRRRSW